MTKDICDRLGIEHPVLQAGLGGGLARAELAAAVSRAGGLGTIGILGEPQAFRRELQRAREQSGGGAVSANLLLPLLRQGHVQACVELRVPVVSLFFGFDRRIVATLHDAGAIVLHQVGTVEQAKRALADGADGLIAQGEAAGGHLLATEALPTFLPKLAELTRDRLLLAAGGIHDWASASAARALGADGVWVGTRFLLTPESHAHDAYKRRLLASERTLKTLLFGMGWPSLHRVVPNAATDRWCARDPLGPRWARALNRAIDPIVRHAPPKGVGAAVRRQRVSVPLYTPAALLRGMDERLLEVVPLYAGECVRQIDALMPAAEIVRELAGAPARNPPG
jgi:nitronate monooxygenase